MDSIKNLIAKYTQQLSEQINQIKEENIKLKEENENIKINHTKEKEELIKYINEQFNTIPNLENTPPISFNNSPKEIIKFPQKKSSIKHVFEKNRNRRFKNIKINMDSNNYIEETKNLVGKQNLPSKLETHLILPHKSLTFNFNPICDTQRESQHFIINIKDLDINENKERVDVLKNILTNGYTKK